MYKMIIKCFMNDYFLYMLIVDKLSGIWIICIWLYKYDIKIISNNFIGFFFIKISYKVL